MTRNPKEVTQMRNLIRKLKTKFPNVEYLGRLEEWVGSGAWSWPPRLKAVPAKKINRCGDVLNGPIYSCKGYEWPMYKNVPMVPFIQLNLGRCSRVSGVDFGTGLLQVWFGFDLFMGGDAFIRVVPADQVHKSKLLPLPAFDMKKMNDGTGTPAFMHWTDPIWDATQIVGYRPRQFTLPHTAMFRDKDEEQKLGLNEDCKRMVEELGSLIDFAQQRFKTGTHLMGTFFAIQYSTSESPVPLFCFDGGVQCYNFGDGNGQLFFERDSAGKISFSLDWSCF